MHNDVHLRDKNKYRINNSSIIATFILTAKHNVTKPSKYHAYNRLFSHAFKDYNNFLNFVSPEGAYIRGHELH